MQKDWKQILDAVIEENPNFSNHIEFLNEYEDTIPGPNRDAKRKRVIRYLSKKNNNNNINNNEKEKSLQETSIFDAPQINLHTSTKQITFGLMGDTHFNSKYAQMTHLKEYYDICKKLGVTDIYHCGDIDDGEQMRPGHVYENYRQGADDHVDEIVKNYPCYEGITTHFITGNHDASFRKSCGLDIGKRISDKRSDLDYIGRDLAIINITDKISLMLRHPWSGSAYALSYKPQKIIEAMEIACIDKPVILGIGHFHKMEYLYYHGIHCFQTGCFQGATPFTVGKGISVAMGGWIITVEIDSSGNLKYITPRAVTFKDAIKEDYKNYL